VAADLHAAMPTGVEEHADAPGPVAAQDDRLLAHRRHEEVARPGDLALVADEEPDSCEDPLLLLVVELVVDEYLAADEAALDIDQAVETAGLRIDRHARPPGGVPDNSASRPRRQT